MKSLKRHFTYAIRHLDFIILDLITFLFSYYVSVSIRRALHKPIWHGELFVKYGIVAVFVYFVIEILYQNLNGITSRSVPKEFQKVVEQMGITWAIYTVILFMLKEAHFFSRSIYASTFFICCFSLLITRTVWKYISQYSFISLRIAPKILIICEASRAQRVLDRLLHGSYENNYEIAGVITTDTNDLDYHDWYPCKKGLNHIPEYLSDWRIQEVYIDLDNAEEEATVIHQLLEAGIMVHRSLGDSRFHYNNQYIDTLSTVSVITITDTRTSLVSKLDNLLYGIKSKTYNLRE